MAGAEPARPSLAPPSRIRHSPPAVAHSHTTCNNAHNTTQPNTTQHNTAQHSTAQHNTTQHPTATASATHITPHHPALHHFTFTCDVVASPYPQKAQAQGCSLDTPVPKANPETQTQGCSLDTLVKTNSKNPKQAGSQNKSPKPKHTGASYC